MENVRVSQTRVEDGPPVSSDAVNEEMREPLGSLKHATQIQSSLSKVKEESKIPPSKLTAVNCSNHAAVWLA